MTTDKKLPVSTLTFQACDRGYIFTNGFSREREGLWPQTWAFNTVEEAAQWLIESQYPISKVEAD